MKSTSPDRRIAVVAVSYELPPTEILERLCALGRRYKNEFFGVIVHNGTLSTSVSTSLDFQILQGSNSLLDFSGYFEGLKQLTSSNLISDRSTILFLNDSLFTKHSPSAVLGQLLEHVHLLEQLMLPAISGKLDPYRSISLKNPWSGQLGYVSSFCFLVNTFALAIIRNLLNDMARDGIDLRLDLTDPEWGIGLDPAFREQIRAHLCYKNSPYSWRAQTSDSLLIGKKAACAYFEQRLSGAIGMSGAVVPINAGPRSQAKLILGESMARFRRLLCRFHHGGCRGTSHP